jgi:hypothetical protein
MRVIDGQRRWRSRTPWSPRFRLFGPDAPAATYATASAPVLIDHIARVSSQEIRQALR